MTSLLLHCPSRPVLPKLAHRFLRLPARSLPHLLFEVLYGPLGFGHVLLGLQHLLARYIPPLSSYRVPPQLWPFAWDFPAVLTASKMPLAPTTAMSASTSACRTVASVFSIE